MNWLKGMIENEESQMMSWFGLGWNPRWRLEWWLKGKALEDEDNQEFDILDQSKNSSSQSLKDTLQMYHVSAIHYC